MGSLSGQKVVVIGASSGIGLEIAQIAAAQGGQVVLASRSLEKLRKQAEAIGDSAQALAVDATDERSVAAFFEQVGAFDHVIATFKASVPGANVVDMDTDAAQAIITSKLIGSFLVAKHGAPFLRRGGSITLTAGVLAWKPSRGSAVLAAVNGALVAFAQTLALEIAPSRVNVISPGIIDTPSWAGMGDERRAGFFQQTAANLPVGRVGQASDIAQAALYLMTNGFTTGTVLHVDGGAQLV